MPSSATGGLRLVCLLFVAIVVLPGCQATQLENRTLRQSATLSDLQYKQVLDNLAMTAANPSALPYFAVAGAGKTSITATPMVNDVVNYDLITVAGVLFNKFIFDKGAITTQYTQQNLDEWDTVPSLDPVQLFLMQGLYRKTLGLEIPQHQLTALNTFFGPPQDTKGTYGAYTAHPMYSKVYAEAMQQLYQQIGPGCFGVGRKCNVPKDACYVGHHCDTYVWVTAAGREALTNLTLAIIELPHEWWTPS
jgi:hypothetical protein